MGVVLALLMLLGALVLWLFFMFPPAYANKKQVSAFNWSCVAFCVIVCGAYAMNMEMVFSAPGIEKYKTFVMLGGALGIETAFLFIMFLLRNFWIFKPRNPSSGYY